MYFNLIFISVIFSKSAANDDLFQTDLGEEFKIGLSDKGYESVTLKCTANHMNVFVETKEDFSGVLYTRGSFYDKKSVCFLDTASSENKKNFTMKFSLKQCNTKKEKDKYTNTLIMQHDHELIMPGDAAFNLECDFRKFRETTDTLIFVEKYVTSKIGLANADPTEASKDNLPLIGTGSNIAVLTPNTYKRNKDEL